MSEQAGGPLARALRAATKIESNEMRTTVLSFLFVFILMAAYFIIRPVRDAMASDWSRAETSFLWTLTFVFSIVAVSLYGYVISRVRFSRVVPGFIVQFGINGDPDVTALWKSRTILDDPVVSSNVRATVAFAMTAPNTRATQIFINLVDNTRLDAGGFSPFGRVIRGMDVLDQLYGGYGETSGGGMRAGRQGPVERGGNDYLEEHFPRLDFILRAVVVTSDG